MTRPGTGAVRSRQLAFLVKACITAGLLVYLLHDLDFAAFFAALAGGRPLLVAATLAMLFAERLFAAFRWFVLLRLVEPEVSYGAVLKITFIANFLGAFLPGSVGIEVLRIYGLARLTSDLPLALSSILAERVFGLSSLFAMVGMGLLLDPLSMPPALTWTLLGGILLLLLGTAALYHPLARRLGRRVLALLPFRQLTAKLEGFARRLDAYAARPGAWLGNFLLGCLNQLLRAASFAVGAAALAIPVDPFAFVVIAPVTVFIALLPISLGGFGPREVTFVTLMATLGVPAESALALVLLREACNLATALPGAILYVTSRGFASAEGMEAVGEEVPPP